MPAKLRAQGTRSSGSQTTTHGNQGVRRLGEMNFVGSLLKTMSALCMSLIVNQQEAASASVRMQQSRTAAGPHQLLPSRGASSSPPSLLPAAAAIAGAPAPVPAVPARVFSRTL